MTEKLNKLFKEIKEITPPENLGGLILEKIELEKSKKAKIKLLLSYLSSAASGLATLYAFFIAGDMLVKSGFWKMASLIFSDLIIVARNWEAYSYLLMETFPVVNVIIILAPVCVLLISLNFLFYFSQKARYKNYFKVQTA